MHSNYVRHSHSKCRQKYHRQASTLTHTPNVCGYVVSPQLISRPSHSQSQMNPLHSHINMLYSGRATGCLWQPLLWLTSAGLCHPLVRHVSTLAATALLHRQRLLRPAHLHLPFSRAAFSTGATRHATSTSTSTSTSAAPTTASTPTPIPPGRVAIIGSGPSAFYTAKYLLKDYPNCTIDMLEALPAPFGLVRYGVAPDHPEVKHVSNDFQSVMNDRRVHWYGNVRVGDSEGPEAGGGVVGLDELLRCYDGVVCSYGAGSERRLDIPGSELSGIVSARSFVNWYNSHPHHQHEGDRLTTPSPAQPAATADSGVEVVVVGQGNVAIDCARVLLKGSAGMKQTDIADHTLQWMSQQPSPVRRVTLLGRRGAVQSAFTIGEFREVSELSDVRVVIDEQEMRESEADETSQRELESSRPKKRKHALIREVMNKHAHKSESRQPIEHPSFARTQVASQEAVSHEKQLHFRFLLSPVRYLPSSADPTRVGAVVCQRMRLQSADGVVTAVPSEAEEVRLPASIVLESIGYMGQPLSTLPFDRRRGVLPSERGRVVGMSGVYVSGWLKRGASGIIGSNITDAKETVASVVEDLRATESRRAELDGEREQLSVVRDRQKWRVVDKEGWKRIDDWERARGREQGRDRVKLVKVDDMLKIAETQPQMT